MFRCEIFGDHLQNVTTLEFHAKGAEDLEHQASFNSSEFP